MRFLSLFSGIEACSVAWEPLGWEPVAFAEVDPFPCEVLAQRFPGVPNLGDVTKVTERDIIDLGHVDLVVFGFPCQDLSVAGKRAGFKGERSVLFYDAMRIVRWSGARWAVAENVPGLFSSHGGRDFAAVVGEMAGAEFDVPRDGWRNAGAASGQDALVEWRTLDAQFVRTQSHPRAVPQRRRRVFLVRDTGDWRDRTPILLEREGLLGNPPPSREAGQRPAPSLASRASAGGGLGTDLDRDGGLIAHRGVVNTLTSKMQGSSGWAPYNETEHLIAHTNAVGRLGDVSATLQSAVGGNGNAGNGSEMIVAHTLRAEHSACDVADSLTVGANQTTGFTGDIVAHTLRAEHDASEDGTGMGVPLVPGTWWDGGQCAATLNTRCHQQFMPDKDNFAAVLSPAIAFHPTQDPINSEEVCHALPQGNGQGYASAAVAISQQSMQVRRLTPLEAERLQGFPDGWTNINYRGKPASDGPRYKALGNSIAVNCVRWIGERIQGVANGIQGDCK